MNYEKMQERVRKIGQLAAGIATGLFFLVLTATGGIGVAVFVFLFIGTIVSIAAALYGLFVFCDVYSDFKSQLSPLVTTATSDWYRKTKLSDIKKENPRCFAICEWLARDDKKNEQQTAN